MLSFVLSPLVDFLRRIGLWRAAAVALSVLVALGAIGLIGTLLGSQAATLAVDVPQYVEAIQGKVGGVQTLATTRVASITRLIGGGSACDRPGHRSSRAAARGTEPMQRLFPVALSNSRSSSSSQRQSPRRSRSPGPSSSRSWPPRDHGHRADRRDFHSDAARGPARQVHTPLRLDGSASDDDRDGRCRPTPQPILRVAAGRECLLRCGDRSGTLADRHTVRSALGRAGRSAPVRPVRRAAAGGGCPT